MEEVSLVMPGVDSRGEWRVRDLWERALPSAAAAVRSAMWSLGSVMIALTAWQLVCLTISKDFPTPLASMRVTLELLRNAFAKVDGMPGIGFQVLASMRRIAIGFSLSAAVAIPAGI